MLVGCWGCVKRCEIDLMRPVALDLMLMMCGRKVSFLFWVTLRYLFWCDVFVREDDLGWVLEKRGSDIFLRSPSTRIRGNTRLAG